MFQKTQLRVIDWLAFFLLMMVPGLNVIVILMILLDRQNNPTLRNFVKAQLLIAILAALLIAAFWSIIFGIIRGYDDNSVTIARIMLP